MLNTASPLSGYIAQANCDKTEKLEAVQSTASSFSVLNYRKMLMAILKH
ncbi:hypothetical protein VB774_21980 [Pseudanabaena galeata UHCC 0370]|uniref:Uncharacterized protein n=1 Tax=Pseudanabaena galeata UHCC 0370 TaxID=3110310 RepID=A0ABU5TPT7_9CYAN|nr:hypothetical protein [Pseudanabaena galeata]MEA5480311.1 hypothetical protein [Pseudanabaena galeata UHCC 0370]